jgi:hypothetical protein
MRMNCPVILRVTMQADTAYPEDFECEVCNACTLRLHAAEPNSTLPRVESFSVL